MTQDPQRNPLQRLIPLLWQQPIWAIGFGLFFGTLFGANREAYWQAYKFSLVFAYAIGLGLWFTRFFVAPRLPGAPSPTAFWVGLAYGSVSLIASYAAALLIHFTFGKELLGSPQSILITGMYSLLFIGLFSGIRF